MRRLALAALLLLAGCESAPRAAAPQLAAKSGPACVLPAKITLAPETPPPADEVHADVPTRRNLLALSWSPEFCATRRDDPGQTVQCRDNHFGFVVHGLWPNGQGDLHPRYCGPAPALDAATVRRNLCMMPGAALMQHEWAAHGTCGWKTGADYLAQVAALWGALKVPDISAAATAGDLRTAFTAANPGLPRDAIFVDLGKGQWLREVRLCLDLKFKPQACPDGRIGAPDGVPMRVRASG